ncbi:MAG: hypothetical protein ACM3WV_08785 [Bacillota bacterium]
MVDSDQKTLCRLLLEEYCRTGGSVPVLAEKIKKLGSRRGFKMTFYEFFHSAGEDWQIHLRTLARDLGFGRRWLKMLKSGDFNRQLLAVRELECLAWPELTEDLVRILPCLDPALCGRIYRLLGALKHEKLLDYLWDLQDRGFMPEWEKIRDELWLQLAVRLFGRDEAEKMKAFRILEGLPGRRSVKLLLIFIENKKEFLEKAWQVLLGYPGDILWKELMYQARFSPFWKLRVGAVKMLLNKNEPRTEQFVRELYRSKDWRTCLEREYKKDEGEIISLDFLEVDVFMQRLQNICRLLAEYICNWKDNEEGGYLH